MPLGSNLLANPECRDDYSGGENWDTGSIGPGPGIRFNGKLAIAAHAFIPLEAGKTYRLIVDRSSDAPVGTRLTGCTTQPLAAGEGATSLDFLAGQTTSEGKLSFVDRSEEAAGIFNLVELREVLAD